MTRFDGAAIGAEGQGRGAFSRHAWLPSVLPLRLWCDDTTDRSVVPPSPYWRDRSGWGRDLLNQTTGVDTINGRPALISSATSGPVATFAHSSPIEVWFVSRVVAAYTGVTMGGAQLWRLDLTTAAVRARYGTTDYFVTPIALAVGTPVLMRYSLSSSRVSAWLNGVAAGMAPLVGPFAMTDLRFRCFGTATTVGAVLCCDPLTTDQAATLTDYFLSRWGL
jgi:hypothetical protein